MPGDDLREKVAAIVDSFCTGLGPEEEYEVADAILNIPEIREALALREKAVWQRRTIEADRAAGTT